MFYQISIMRMKSSKEESETCLHLMVSCQYDRQFGSTQAKMSQLAALKVSFIGSMINDIFFFATSDKFSKDHVQFLSN